MRALNVLSVGVAFAVAAVFATACSRPDDGVRSHLQGRITVDAAVDSSADYSGFSVVVAGMSQDKVDTLAVATTDIDGRFAMDVVAQDEGVYPIMIRRHGGLLKQGQIVVVEGDSATMQLKLPTGRPVTIRSSENGAWMAYRNTKAAHAANVRQMASTGEFDATVFRSSLVQASNILWNLSDTYPETLGAALGRFESVVMLASWDDSLAVERLRRLPGDGPGVVAAVRAGWRATERVAGLDSALATIDHFILMNEDAGDRGALRAERVVALMDGGRIDSARVEAELLTGESEANVPQEWRSWAEAALYEIDNLLPGHIAPSFAAVARNGVRFDIANHDSELMLLEFYSPDSEQYQQDLALRMRLNDLPGLEELRVVSISMEPDADLNDAFIDSRNLPGVHIVAKGGAEDELVQLYNVQSGPKRFLIRDGVIVSKYHGRALEAVVNDILELADPPA